MYKTKKSRLQKAYKILQIKLQEAAPCWFEQPIFVN